MSNNELDGLLNDVAKWRIEAAIVYPSGVRRRERIILAPWAVANLALDELCERIEEEHGKGAVGSHYLTIEPAE